MADDTLDHLTRLSQKPGVQSTLILSRQDGAIVRATGLISESTCAKQNGTLPPPLEDEDDAFADSLGAKKSGMKSAEQVARLVWGFLETAGTLVGEMDKEDEVRLLRLRTRRNELVVVPDAKFILVVIHDTPQA